VPVLQGPISDAVLLIPTHRIILPANFTHILRISISRPQLRSSSMIRVIVPAMPLVVWHAKAFASLHAFLVSPEEG